VETKYKAQVSQLKEEIAGRDRKVMEVNSELEFVRKQMAEHTNRYHHHHHHHRRRRRRHRHHHVYYLSHRYSR